MPFWKVRPGAKFAHAGQTLKPGSVVELPRRIALEFAHAIDECTPAGAILTAPKPAWEVALETIPAHETVDILREERAKQAETVQNLAIQLEQAQTDADALAATLSDAQASLAALDARLEDEILTAQIVQQDRLAEEAAAASADTDPVDRVG